ncbi:hypothetical protein CORC01_06208 [Colletotrichum orchidophilum]|uniref:Uncharacterized protein n=1 Tax=Colletotrichum orchidophilum TaxID=1209926 RepID=A0A1G4BAI6_9PEZI|nr:uncharacterized protein CORC01_06208 [Colletotrichum orchidophilum]OHE98417.1 hypothetical protein CORC01_06208 [Colletotrichum orchidophilum]
MITSALAQGRASLALGNIVAFGAYLLSIVWAISRGTLVPPEASDSDSSSDSEDSDSSDSSSTTWREINAGEKQPVLRPSERFLRRRRLGLTYHIAYLFAGFLAICLSGYILSMQQPKSPMSSSPPKSSSDFSPSAQYCQKSSSPCSAAVAGTAASSSPTRLAATSFCARSAWVSSW